MILDKKKYRIKDEIRIKEKNNIRSALAVPGALWGAGSDIFSNDCVGKTVGAGDIWSYGAGNGFYSHTSGIRRQRVGECPDPEKGR